jgi:hypothetical protein
MAARSLNIEPANLCYRVMIGTGGIGSGAFFELRGNHTLGREESRAGRFLDRRDYCKLHIIAHYVQTLLGAGFRTVPLGAVGDDDVGKKLLLEMVEAGLDASRVATIADKPTLYSFCFVYPDGSGGNLTTDDSASSHVDGSLIRGAEAEFLKHRGRGIALAVPEVSLEARRALLRLGRSYQLLRSASFTTEELRDPGTELRRGRRRGRAGVFRRNAAGVGGRERGAASFGSLPRHAHLDHGWQSRQFELGWKRPVALPALQGRGQQHGGSRGRALCRHLGRTGGRAATARGPAVGHPHGRSLGDLAPHYQQEHRPGVAAGILRELRPATGRQCKVVAGGMT